MPYNDILVHIDSGKTNPARLDAAIALAQRHDAHLTGLYVIPQIAIPTYAEVHIPTDIVEQQEREANERAQTAAAQFKTALEQAGVQGECRLSRGYTDQQLIIHGRNSDIIVLGQAEQAGMLSIDLAVDDMVVMGAGRPVLFVPYIGVRQEPIGGRVLVAWNGGREAARAVHDALPMLTRADLVEIVAVNPPAGSGDIPTADICLHLARHGVKAEGGTLTAKDIDVGDALLSHAADRGIDAIVMGAYGHTRLRETILGGVTKHLLAHMTVPVLMSH